MTNFEKLKEWLIHKLGGFTTAELVDEPLQFPVCTKRTTTLKTYESYDRFFEGDNTYRYHNQKELAYRLADMMFEAGLITFAEAEITDFSYPLINAMIEVVIPEEDAHDD